MPHAVGRGRVTGGGGYGRGDSERGYGLESLTSFISYRLGRPQQGFGPGLAICKRLVEAAGIFAAPGINGGIRLDIYDHDPEGLCVAPSPKPADVVDFPKGGCGHTARREGAAGGSRCDARAAGRLPRGDGARSAPGGHRALHLLMHDQPDVLLLDLMLPDIDGTEILRRMRFLSRPAALRCILAVSGDVRDARTAGSL